GTVLRQRATKAPLSFEILVTTRDDERIALAFQRDLKRAGIEASVRVVDPVQFDQRRLAFDFDMIPSRWDQSLSPGNEQSFYWGSEAAGVQGTRNYMGAKDPAIDALFQRILSRKPDAPALLDPINKQRITGQPPKRLSYREADHAISALAAHFVESGLPANSIVAVQLPNTVEFALTVLAAHRAGLVVAVLPLLWRQAELVAALNRTAARAIVTSSRVDGVGYADLAMNAAAEAFSIRHVCGFGNDLPDGMASLDRALANPSSTTRTVIQ